MKLDTKYPVLLVHGVWIRDDWKHFASWGRLYKRLEAGDCRVFCGGQPANGSVEANAACLKARIEEVLRETGAEKVNVIAHSKGGLDTRYAISHLGMGEKIATLSTMSTPHRGSRSVDVLTGLPDFLVKGFCRLVDGVFYLLGERGTRFYDCVCLFRTKDAARFNEENPDDGRVHYRGYAFVMKHWYSDILLSVPYLFVRLFDGPSDGLLSPWSTEWGDFQGVFTGTGFRGVSHFDEVDFRRLLFTKKQGDGVSDMVDFYVGVVEELKKAGY